MRRTGSGLYAAVCGRGVHADRVRQLPEFHQGAGVSQWLPEREGTSRQLFLLVCEMHGYSTVLDATIARASLLRGEKQQRPHLAEVLLYKLLLGKGFHGGGSQCKSLLWRHQTLLKAELARLKVRRGMSKNEDLVATWVGVGVPAWSTRQSVAFLLAVLSCCISYISELDLLKDLKVCKTININQDNINQRHRYFQ